MLHKDANKDLGRLFSYYYYYCVISRTARVKYHNDQFPHP